MARHSSKKKVTDTRGRDRRQEIIDIGDTDDEPAPLEAPRFPQTSTVKNKNKNKTRAPPPTTDNDSEEPSDDEDELAYQVVPVVQRVKKPSLADIRKEKDVLVALRATAALLSSLGDKDEIERIIKLPGSRNNDELLDCRAKLVALLSPPAPESAQQGETPEIIHLFDQYFAHQGPNRELYILRPVEVIQGNMRLARGKVAGFVRHQGDSFPLKYALPGWMACNEPHPNVLDSALWTKEVQRWGEFHNHHFPGHPFEKRHGKEKGHASASHVEIRLMLWYACEKTKEIAGDKPVRALLGEIWRLRNFAQDIEAEVFLTRAPCNPCLEIKKLIEEYTGIKFNIRVMQNLGELEPVKNKTGWITFDRFASQIEDQDGHRGFSEDIETVGLHNQRRRNVLTEGIEIVERENTTEVIETYDEGLRNSAIQVVIPAQSRAGPRNDSSWTDSSPVQHRQQQPKNPRSVSTTTTSVTRRIQGFQFQPASSQEKRYQPAPPSSQGKHHIDLAPDSESEEDPEYRPPGSQRTKTTTKTTVKINSASTACPDFGAEARKQAERLKRQREKKNKKRAREPEMASSTHAPKKSRNLRFED
ncbi:uncharacterized protein L3040_002512 [Drepanopeziza brunnea f. sp. 'multigermtubi']|uniref:uncharacterized protein n=2 Tax=Drepanopeziza brunnea f. sp. 'multigermtubi' TaxID=698441 RepID=UPI002383F6E5|nr:hypothetical protein L3040_002512 [Drepanopeziza brunnea f. sp. 'multigermtubi']